MVSKKSGDTEESSLGRFKWWAIAAICISIGVITHGIYNWNSEKTNLELAGKVFEFEKEYLSKFTKKEIGKEEVLKGFQELMDKSSAPVLVLSGIHVADGLMEQSAVEEARDLLLSLKKKKATILAKYFLLTRLSVAQEDLKDYEGAIKSLEESLQLETVVLSDKIYFDLGRLYFKSGNMKKAKMSFDYIIDKSSDADLLKLTRIYLTKLPEQKIN